MLPCNNSCRQPNIHDDDLPQYWKGGVVLGKQDDTV